MEQSISLFGRLKLFGEGKIYVSRNCDVAPFCDFEVPGEGILKIGEGYYFNRYCMISAHQEVTIGNRCMFGPGVKIFDNNHRHSPETGGQPGVDDGAHRHWGRMLDRFGCHHPESVKIGKNCVIGAGCIISGIIPDGSVVRVRQTLEIR